MAQEAISIKGIRQGLLVKWASEWAVGLQALEAQLAASPAFFQDGRVALDVGDLALDHADVEQAQALLARHQVELWALISTSPITRAVARYWELETDLEPPQPQPRRSRAPVEPPPPPPPPPTGDLVVHRTLRSGQTLRHKRAVVIIGDVNPGAEVIAGGDIIVWGRARGVLHAGAFGDESALICALDLSPMQLRIAAHIALAPEGRRRKPVPEMASVRDGQIVAVPWQGAEFG